MYKLVQVYSYLVYMYVEQVFDQAFGLAADPGRDSSISNRLRSLAFLKEEHLGVPPLVDAEVRCAVFHVFTLFFLAQAFLFWYV